MSTGSRDQDAAPQAPLERLVVESSVARLEEIRQQAADATATLIEQFHANINSYKETYRDLIAHKGEVVRNLASSNADAAQALTLDPRYFLVMPERTIFSNGGITVGYMPSHEKDPNFTATTLDPTAASKGTNILSDVKIEFTRTPSTPNPTDAWPSTPPPARPPPSACPRTPLPNGPRRKQAARRATIVDCPVIAPARKTPRRSTKSGNLEGQHRAPALTNPVRDSDVGSQWVFEYTLGQTTDIFVISCPKTGCQNATFLRHPIHDDRAAQHLKACDVKFKSENDMVRRYAHRVITSTGGEVSRSWVRKHNSYLLKYKGNKRIPEEEPAA